MTNPAPPFNLIHQDQNLIILQTTSQSTPQEMLGKHSSYGNGNLGLHVHDTPKNVLHNRTRLLNQINQTLNQNLRAVHWLNQIHSNHILDIDQSALTFTAPNADALICSTPNTALAIMTADCLPIVLHQATTKKIAVIHAGWQGLAQGIIHQTTQKFDPKKGTIQAWIGACISPKNYEVQKNLIYKIILTMQKNQTPIDQAPDQLAQIISQPHPDLQKTWLDLPKLASLQLHTLNIQLQTPINTLTCSYDDSQYYSYRRQTHQHQAHTGRMATIAFTLSPTPSVF